MSTSTTRMFFLLALVSGGSALIYETVWMRWFRLLFGNTAHAASATLCAFFVGLALGTAVFARISSRTQTPLRLYGIVEVGIAVAALWTPLAISLYEPIYSGLYRSFAESGTVFLLVKFLLAAVAMIPTSFLLGGTLPLLVTALAGDRGGLGKLGSRLYAVNTLGAAVGVVLGAFWLPEWVGVNATYTVGVAGTIVVAVAALILSRREGPSPIVVTEKKEHGPSLGAAPLLVSGASGFGTLAAQVLLVHSLGQLYSHSAYSFGMVLLVVLASLGFSAILVSLTTRLFSAQSLLRGAALVEGFLLLILPGTLFASRSADATGLYSFLDSLHLDAYWVSLVFVICAGVPIFVVGGLVFPLTFRLAQNGPVGRQLGRLLAANTVGGIIGSLAASFVLLEFVGLWSSVAILGLLYGVAAVLVPGTRQTRAITAGVFLFVLAITLVSERNPWTVPTVTLRPGDKLVAVSQGAHGIVSVVDDREGHRRIKVDDRYEFGYSKETMLFERSGHLPLLLHPAPKKVAFIGSATGSVAGAATQHPVEEIHVVELVPAVQEFAARHFGVHNRNVHADPRTRNIAEDGRNHLRGTSEQYDVIVEDLFVPYRPSAAAMYSRDHYADAKARLTKNGVFCQWLPIYQLDERLLRIIMSTFLEEFPEGTLWRAHVRPNLPMAALIGSRGRLPDQTELEARTRELKALKIEDRWVTDAAGIWFLYIGPVAAVFEGRERSPVHSDEHPIFEFEGSRYIDAVVNQFRFNAWPKMQEELVALGTSIDPVYPDRNLNFARAAVVLERSNLAAIRRETDLAKREFKEASQWIPRHLLSRPDLSFSLVWPSAH